MEFERLQYITDSLLLAREACDAGVKWIQGRVKNKRRSETQSILMEMKDICDEYGAIFIVNDFIEIALEINAGGVHLGKEDISVEEAKKLIGGRKFILGGTSNTFEDVKRLAELKVDYIGLGPFRFTNTKEKLSPVLGLDGYQYVINKLNSERIAAPPVYAIGGIVAADVRALREAGVHGVAVSGAISNASDKKIMVDDFNMKLKSVSHAE